MPTATYVIFQVASFQKICAHLFHPIHALNPDNHKFIYPNNNKWVLIHNAFIGQLLQLFWMW
jgi:hypothetical protein